MGQNLVERSKILFYVISNSQANALGQYTRSKISLKSGSLDFILPLLDDDNSTMISIEPCKPGVAVSFDSDIGGLLADFVDSTC